MIKLRKIFGHFLSVLSLRVRHGYISVTQLQLSSIIDATRIYDNYKVAIKVVKTSSDEIPIAQYLLSDPRKSDPRNRTVPIVDIILLPETDLQALIVMPMLLVFYLLPFRRVGEFTEAVYQYLQV
jgi:hypothetical protein